MSGYDITQDLVTEAIECIAAVQRASTATLQRRLKLSYGQAADLMDELERRGLVGPANGSDPREILFSNKEGEDMAKKDGGRKVIPIGTVGEAMDKAAAKLADAGVKPEVINAEKLRSALDSDLPALVSLLIDGIKAEFNALVDEHGVKIVHGFSKAYVAHCEDEPDSEKKWKFKLGVGVTITPMGSSYGITAACRHGITRKHVSLGRMVQLQLPLSGHGS